MLDPNLSQLAIDAIATAIQHRKEGNYATAREGLQAAWCVAHSNDNKADKRSLHFHLASIHLICQEMGDAEAHLLSALSFDPPHLMATICLADLHTGRKELFKAARCLEEFRNRTQNNEEVDDPRFERMQIKLARHMGGVEELKRGYQVANGFYQAAKAILNKLLNQDLESSSAVEVEIRRMPNILKVEQGLMAVLLYNDFGRAAGFLKNFKNSHRAPNAKNAMDVALQSQSPRRGVIKCMLDFNI